MMTEMASKGIFESNTGSKKRGAKWQNIADNLNNCEEFTVTVLSLRDQLLPS